MQQDTVSTVVIKRDDGITHSQEASTEVGQPNVQIAAMSAAYAIFVRSLRVFAQSFSGMLTAQWTGGVDAILQAQVTPSDLWSQVQVAFWLAIAPAAFTLVQNAAELVMRLDEKLPRFRACIAFALLAFGAASCAGNPPPNLTPEATIAYQATRAVKVLDVLRDAAIDANATNPPLLSEGAARKVVRFHQATLKTIQASPEGWRPTAVAGLKEVEAELTGADKDRLAAYIRLARTILEATR